MATRMVSYSDALGLFTVCTWKFRMIRLPALQAAKVELYREWVATGIRKAHQSRFDHIEAAFKALGKEIASTSVMRPDR